MCSGCRDKSQGRFLRNLPSLRSTRTSHLFVDRTGSFSIPVWAPFVFRKKLRHNSVHHLICIEQKLSLIYSSSLDSSHVTQLLVGCRCKEMSIDENVTEFLPSKAQEYYIDVAVIKIKWKETDNGDEPVSNQVVDRVQFTKMTQWVRELADEQIKSSSTLCEKKTYQLETGKSDAL